MNGVISLFCTPEDANFRYKSYSKKALDDGFIYNYAQDNSHITRLSKKTELWLKTESGKWVRYEGQKLVKFFDQQYNCSDLPHYEASDVYLLYLINKYLKNANFIITRLKEKGLVSPSDEQIAIIKAALRGESLKVQAFAGTGKTTTIKMIAACLDMQSTYVVFNAAAKDSAKGNIENAFVTTAHGLAYKSTISTNIGLNNKFKNNQKTWFLSEIKKCFPKLLDTELGYITRTVKRFIKTADKKISIEHINKKDVSSIKLRCEPISKKAIRLVLSIAEKLKDFNGKHMIYQQKKFKKKMVQKMLIPTLICILIQMSYLN